MTSPQENQGMLLNEGDLDAMVVDIDSTRAIRRARDPVTEFREFHGWTLDKLDVFDTYLKLYRRVAGGGAYIDAVCRHRAWSVYNFRQGCAARWILNHCRK